MSAAAFPLLPAHLVGAALSLSAVLISQGSASFSGASRVRHSCCQAQKPQDYLGQAQVSPCLPGARVPWFEAWDGKPAIAGCEKPQECRNSYVSLQKSRSRPENESSSGLSCGTGEARMLCSGKGAPVLPWALRGAAQGAGECFKYRLK